MREIDKEIFKKGIEIWRKELFRRRKRKIAIIVMRARMNEVEIVRIEKIYKRTKRNEAIQIEVNRPKRIWERAIKTKP